MKRYYRDRTVDPETGARPPCAGCGGPHPFDTVVPNGDWNRVVRGAGLADYLCLGCIVGAFARAGEGLVAELWGPEGSGLDGTVVALVL